MSLLLQLKEHHIRVGGIVAAKGIEHTRRARPTEPTKQGPQGPTETEAAAVEPALVFARSSEYMLWLLAWWFYETPDSGSACHFCLLLVTLPSTRFPHPALMQAVPWSFLYLIVPCSVVFTARPSLFERARGKEWICGRGEVGTHRQEWREVKLPCGYIV